MAASMTMPAYLAEVHHAVDSLMPLLWSEREQLQELADSLEGLNRTVQREYTAADFLALNADDPEEVMFAAARQQETYWGADKDRYYTQEAHDTLEAQIAARRFSVEALAGSIIQFAKQGLALVHGRRPSPAVGRTVGSTKLSDVVWAARNQALHWEDQSFNGFVNTVFGALASVDSVFADFTTRNMAFDVVDCLGWRSVVDFERDLQTLG